jgi:hypothetical protein
MAQLGSPVTNLFEIGTAEVRVGPLSMANKLTQAYSVGLIDSVSVEVSQDTVTLEGGFPRRTVDSAIVRQNASITCQAHEYSRRNLKVQLGEGIDASPPVDFETLLVSNEALGATVITVTTGDGDEFAEDDIIVIYPDGQPEKVSVCRVASVDGDNVTLDSGTPTLFAYDGTVDTIKIFLGHSVAIGGSPATQYFAVSVISQERGRDGRPRVWNFWKASVASGLSFSTNAENFAGTELKFNALQPAVSEYSSGGDLFHLANIIPTHPVGMLIAGGDLNSELTS